MIAHLRTLRGRDAIAAVLESFGLPPDEARSRAGNMAVAIGEGDPRTAVRESMAGRFWTVGDTADVLAAWVVSEREAAA